MKLYASWIWVCSCLAAPILAQERREEVFGTIKLPSEDLARDAWIGAKVVLVSHPFPFDARIGVTDRVECTLGQHARFRAKLIAGRSYSAWAWREASDGARTFTKVVTAVRAGMPIVFEPEASPRRAIRVSIQGIGPWSGSGAMRCVAATSGDALDRFEVEVTTDGTVTVPPLPGDRIDVDVRRSDGMTIVSHSCTAYSLQRDPRVALDLALPHTYDVRITDEQGAPLQGAEIHRDPSGPALILASTAADGTAQLILPRPGFVHRGLSLAGDVLLTQKPGYAPSLLMLGPRDVLVGRATPSLGLHGRLVLREGRPAAGVEVVLAERIENPEDPKLPSHSIQCVQSDRNGAFRFAGVVGDRKRSCLFLVFPPGLLHVDCDPLVVDPVAIEAADIGTIDLSALTLVELEVRESDGSPAAFALVRRSAAEHLGRFGCAQTRTDARGHLSFLLSNVVSPFFVSSSSGSALFDPMTAPDENPGAHRFEIVLRPQRVVEGRITDANGAPAANMLYEVAHRTPGPQIVRGLARTGPTSVPWLGLASVIGFTTDTDGRFEVRIDDFGLSLDVRPSRFARSALGIQAPVAGVPIVMCTIKPGAPSRGLELVERRSDT